MESSNDTVTDSQTPAETASITLDLSQVGSLVAASIAKQAAKDIKEQNDAAQRCDEVAHVLAMEKYVVKRNGLWDCEMPLQPSTIKTWLITRQGATPKAAKAILEYGRTVVADAIENNPGAPPTFERHGRIYLNAYRPSDLAPVQGKWDRLSWVLDNVTGFEPEARKWLFNWYAAKVQNPGALMVTAPVFLGAQGTGKNVVGRAIRTILGEHNCALVSSSQLHKEFNVSFATKLFIEADEVLTGSNFRDESDHLKVLTGSDTLPIEGKGANVFIAQNHSGWMFTSNRSMPVKIEAGDRRFAVFSQPISPPEDRKEMMRLLFNPADNSWSESARVELAAFAFDLMHHQVDWALVRQPYHSKAREALMEATRGPVEAFIAAIEEEGILNLACEDGYSSLFDNFKDETAALDGWVPKRRVTEVFRIWARGKFDRLPSDSLFFGELYRHRPNWTSGRPRRKADGKRVQAVSGIPLDAAEARHE